MLQLFRSIQITGAFTLAVYVAMLHAAALSGHVTALESMPDAGLFYDRLFGWAAAQPFWSALAAAVLVYIQALLVNLVADHFRLMNDRNWLPGMAYALAASALPDFQFLCPPLVAATFLIVALRKVFQTYKSPKSAILVFDTAFWISAGGLFFPKIWWMLFAAFMAIGVMRSWNTRDIMAFVTGVFVPQFLGWLWFLWGDNGGAFRSRHFGELLSFIRLDEAFGAAAIGRALLLGLIFMAILINYGSFMRNKSMHAQKCVTVLYLFLAAGAATALMRKGIRWETFALTAAPAGIFLAMMFHSMRPLFAELLHLVLIGMVFYLQFA